MLPRPRAYFVSSENYERAIDDPALGALAAEGWSVVSATVVARGKLDAKGEEVAELMLLLWPPPRAIAAVDVVRPPPPGGIGPVVASALAVGAVVGMLVAGAFVAAISALS